MDKISLNSFFAFCKGLQGQSLPTIGERASFTLSLVDENDALYYIPDSTGKERRVAKHYIDEVLKRFAVTHSFKPSDYTDITRNASYTLALIKRYL